VLNEPPNLSPSCEGGDLEGFFRAAGEAIRSLAPAWLLIFEFTPPSEELLHTTSPPPFERSVYSMHLYAPDWRAALPLMDAGWKLAKSWNIPMYLGEFDAFRASKGDPSPTWEADTLSLLEFMSERSISWAVFAYRGFSSLFTPSGEPRTELIETLQRGFGRSPEPTGAS
jgi:hypothetical protein